MKTLVQQTVELLKLKVKENLDQIKQNQLAIKDILKQPSSEERTRLFEDRYRINKDLLSENNDYINVQLTLINFLDKYRDRDILEEHTSIEIDIKNIEEVFEYTKTGYLPFNSSHPYFDDHDFFGRLLKYYEENEQYEQCQKLLETKSR